MKNIRQNLPFIATIAAFIIACAVITVLTVRDEPQYMRVIADNSDNFDNSETIESPSELLPEFTSVNINTADSEELQTLPGVGPVLAERIITYREAHKNGFLHLEELMEVSGIGEQIFERIREMIYID